MSKQVKAKVSIAEKTANAQQMRDAEVRRINNRFMRSPPPEILSSGVYTVPKEDIADAPRLAVPNGKYRIVGLDFIHEFKDGKWIATEKAGPNSASHDITDIP